jgi:hypothetical protein
MAAALYAPIKGEANFGGLVQSGLTAISEGRFRRLLTAKSANSSINPTSRPILNGLFTVNVKDSGP